MVAALALALPCSTKTGLGVHLHCFLMESADLGSGVIAKAPVGARQEATV